MWWCLCIWGLCFCFRLLLLVFLDCCVLCLGFMCCLGTFGCFSIMIVFCVLIVFDWLFVILVLVCLQVVFVFECWLLVGFRLVWFGIYLVCFALSCGLDYLGWIDLIWCFVVLWDFILFYFIECIGLFWLVGLLLDWLIVNIVVVICWFVVFCFIVYCLTLWAGFGMLVLRCG